MEGLNEISPADLAAYKYYVINYAFAKIQEIFNIGSFSKI